MNANKPSQPDRLERVARGLLGLALAAAVGWAWATGDASSTLWFNP